MSDDNAQQVDEAQDAEKTNNDAAQDATSKQSTLDSDALQKELERARKEAAGYRSRLRDTEAKLKSTQELSSQVDQLTSELNELRIRGALSSVASDVGVDADLTFAHLSSRGLLSGVDHSDAEALKEIVEKAADEKPALRLQRARPLGDGAAANGDAPQFSMNNLIRGAFGRS